MRNILIALCFAVSLPLFAFAQSPHVGRCIVNTDGDRALSPIPGCGVVGGEISLSSTCPVMYDSNTSARLDCELFYPYKEITTELFILEQACRQNCMRNGCATFSFDHSIEKYCVSTEVKTFARNMTAALNEVKVQYVCSCAEFA